MKFIEHILAWRFFITNAFRRQTRQVSCFRRGIHAHAHKCMALTTRERKCRVFHEHEMGAHAPVMKLKSHQSRDVLLRWRIYTPHHLKIRVQHPMVTRAYRIRSCLYTSSKCECRDCRARRVCVT